MSVLELKAKDLVAPKKNLAKRVVVIVTMMQTAVVLLSVEEITVRILIPWQQHQLTAVKVKVNNPLIY